MVISSNGFSLRRQPDRTGRRIGRASHPAQKFLQLRNCATCRLPPFLPIEPALDDIRESRGNDTGNEGAEQREAAQALRGSEALRKALDIRHEPFKLLRQGKLIQNGVKSRAVIFRHASRMSFWRSFFSCSVITNDRSSGSSSRSPMNSRTNARGSRGMCECSMRRA